MRKPIFVLLLLLVGVLPAAAQSVAVRYIIVETHKIYKHPTFDNFCMGLGVDRSFNDRLTAGFDITYDIGNALKPDGAYLSLNSNGVTANYQTKLKLLSLNYHTEYALGENDGTHVYIGTFIGLRHITQKWVLENAYSVNNNGSPSSYRSFLDASKWLVPIGLRMGVRGATDSGFMDFYAAFGYQVGGGKRLFEGALYRSGSKDRFMETSPLAITMGLAYGIGW